MARSDATRKAKLVEQHLVSAREVEEAEAIAGEREAAVRSLESRVKRTKEQGLLAESANQAEMRKIEGKLAYLRGEVKISGQAVQAQANEVAHHEVRAPISGRVAEMREVQVGSYIQAGEWVATIVPEGSLGIVAYYSPSGSLGRIRPGQSARLRLTGFPWPQYGAVPARVTAVAAEPRDGRVRVELAITGEPPRQLPAQHGLPGTLEVDLERISPALLALRAAGKMAVGREDLSAAELAPGGRSSASSGTGEGAPAWADPFAGVRSSSAGDLREEE
jgi:membrane fusion protein (multidrug efflux system)